MMDSMLKTMLRCSIDQADTLISAYRDEQGWHAETVIAAAGALVGHAIQASAYSMAAQATCHVGEFDRQTNPPFGRFVNCGERLQLFFKTELDFVLTVAEQLNWFPREAVPDVQALLVGVLDQVGGEWFPRLGVASEHQPHEWSPDAVPRFLRKMRAHLDRHKLPHNVCEVLCQTLALGHLISASRDRLDPKLALRIGLEMAIATANIGNLDRTHVATADEATDEISAESDLTASRAAVADDAQRDLVADEPAGEMPSVADTAKHGKAGKVVFKPSVPVEAAMSAPAAAAAPEPIADLHEVEDAIDERNTGPAAAVVGPGEVVELSTGTAVNSHVDFLRDADSSEDDLDALPTPRASRLVRTRPQKTAFGKRQFG